MTAGLARRQALLTIASAQRTITRGPATPAIAAARGGDPMSSTTLDEAPRARMLLSITDVAAELGCGRDTVYALLTSGQLPPSGRRASAPRAPPRPRAVHRRPARQPPDPRTTTMTTATKVLLTPEEAAAPWESAAARRTS